MLCRLCHTPVNFSVCPNCNLKTTDSPEVYPLRFGKYRGSTVEQVHSIEPSYLKWMVNNNVGSPAQRAKARLYLSRNIVPAYSRSQSTNLLTTSQNTSNTMDWIILAVVGVIVIFAFITNQNKTITTSPTGVQPASVEKAAPGAQGDTSTKQFSQEGKLTYQAAGCNVKGNVAIEDGERIYHVPGGKYYSSTVIDTRYGERWFCSEKDAVNNGWRKSTS